MGNTYSLEETNIINQNINVLTKIGIDVKNNSYELNDNNKKYIISLYKTFYFPKHSLTKIEEINENHYHLRKILKNHILLFNKYNSLNIDVIKYINDTYESLKPTLYIIDV